METALRFVATGLAAYALIVAAAYFFQRSLMYFPDTSAPQRALAGLGDMQEVTLRTADGIELTSWYKPPAAPELGTVVYFHGNGGNIEGRGFKVRPMLDAGYGVLLVSYRGYGGNGGSPSEEGFYADGRAALDYLAAQGVVAERVALYGESLGAGVAVQMAAERPVKAVVLEAPFTAAADVGAAAYPFLPVRLLIKDRFASIDKIDDIDAPLLLLHGEADRVVSVKLGRALLGAADEPKQGVFFPGAGHENLFDYGAAEPVVEFLGRNFSE